jgi:putative transposase
MSRPPRIEGFTYRGCYQYFLTFCTIERRRVFVDAQIAAVVVEHFLRTSQQWSFALLAYCVMPDHAHLLVEGTSAGSDLRRFAKRLKQGAGQAYAHRCGAPLWQEGYFDHVLRGDEDARQVARYILDNPVRAGLVRRPLDYPYLGSGVWKLEDLLSGVA